MDIRFTQNIYPSAAGGDAKISYYVLFPVGAELRGIVQISHGMCEYFTRYTAFAKYLCSLGYIVCGKTIWVRFFGSAVRYAGLFWPSPRLERLD